MRFQYLLSLLGLALIALGTIEGRWLILALWLGSNFLVLGIAHAKGAHRVFGKRPDGSLSLWNWLVFLPLLVLTSAVWHLTRLVNRRPAANVVTDHLTVGRRLLPSEVPREFDNYVDLTAEFTEPPSIRHCTGYVCFPILDRAAPSPEALRDMVGRLRPGTTFVHCAQGYGRTGLFALAVLLATGAAGSVDEGLRMLRAVRPGIRLNREQRRCIEQFAAREQ